MWAFVAIIGKFHFLHLITLCFKTNWLQSLLFWQDFAKSVCHEFCCSLFVIPMAGDSLRCLCMMFRPNIVCAPPPFSIICVVSSPTNLNVSLSFQDVAIAAMFYHWWRLQWIGRTRQNQFCHYQQISIVISLISFAQLLSTRLKLHNVGLHIYRCWVNVT